MAINGFGRIGRAVFRIAAERKSKKFKIVAINDLTPIENLAYLLRFDSVHGPFPGTVAVKGNKLVVDGQAIPVFAEKDPTKLPWGKLKIDAVVESTGFFLDKVKASQHITAGAKRVIISAPAKDKVDLTVVVGANHKLIKRSQKVISNASCSTNCAVPVCKVLDEAFKIKSAHFTIAHSYTGSQSLVDSPNKKFSQGRAGAINIIPTSTGADKAIVLALPRLKGKISGIAVRVPVVDGSLFALSAVVSKKT
ncbi:MAG: glyceraldehyde 3-phosphate dehydrogenase NAD-binding domain-containing protein, partial [Anaerolineales bacterium]|nr:glyceraldehyde 3-phosphate dehydrogenase NAD-binding domain-containing protein [Anaerolineales bacterium]